MRMVKVLAPLGTLLLSGVGIANTSFVCGTVTCSAFGSQPITGIDNLVVDGNHYDVSFSNTSDTPFLFSSNASASGQASTGVDAANALDAFYATQQGPSPQSDGPGIFAQVGGTDVEVLNIVTAFETAGTPGVVDVDITQPFLGGGYTGPTLVAPDVGSGLPPADGSEVVVSHLNSQSLCGRNATCTVWTPIVAPEMSSVSAISEIVLLLGCFGVLWGHRPRQLNGSGIGLRYRFSAEDSR